MQSGDLEGAIAQLEQAHAADPNDFQTCLYLGAAYGKAERHREAVTILTEAVQLQPANAQARYNLAVALESAGYPEQAQTAAQQAVQLQPDYPKAQEMTARLAGTTMAPEPYTLPAAPQYGQPQPPPQQPYGQTPPYGQPAAPPYGQAQPPYGQHSQAPSGQPLPPYGQPSTPYGQSQPPYGQPQQPDTGQALQPNVPYQPQGAASYGGPPNSIYAQPYGAGPMFQTEAPAANTALILSLVGLLSCMCGLCLLLGPIAIGFAIQAKKQIAQNPNLTGGGKATAAMVIGIIECLILVTLIVVLAVGLFSGNH